MSLCVPIMAGKYIIIIHNIKILMSIAVSVYVDF